MARRGTHVALLTDRRYTASAAAADDWYLANILADDRLLAEALLARGVSSARVDWADRSVDWSAFAAAVFRTTWDYYDRQAEFTAWLDAVEPRTRLVNDAATVRWNRDKHYLADLASAGVPTVPTRFLERGTRADLGPILVAEGWREGVVKPAVSGGARHTYRFDGASAGSVAALVAPVLEEEAFLVQPFVPDILDHGEDTLVIVDGRCTHALTKRARPGDFRVQDDHGGTVHACAPVAEQILVATAAMAQHPGTAYGRVDMVRMPDGRWGVMELELIEPELWLRRHPPAATALADAIVARLG